jgi:hypothetical protein
MYTSGQGPAIVQYRPDTLQLRYWKCDGGGGGGRRK